MIFVTNADGIAIYISEDWTALTGLTLAETASQGWASVLHPADLTTVRDIVLGATRDQQPFNVCYRARRRAGGYAWIASGARPAFGPPDRRFLGFMGTMRVLEGHVTGADAATGSIGSYAPHATQQDAGLEAVADHLIGLHAALTEIGPQRIKDGLGLVEMLMFEVGKELARGIEASAPPSPERGP